ncbi:MAG: hypothetical protein Q9168_000082 [Polycauliona sp. 1 TL-2023]
MAEERKSLTMLAEKMSPLLINPSHLSYCPTMDLLALGAQDERVHVFRLNGQRVFGVSKKDAVSRVTCIQWHPNASANSGKIMHEKVYPTPSNAPICCLGWASNFTDVAATRRRMASLEGTVVLDDLMTSADETLSPQYAMDLPIELAFVDVASTLPRLSTLPVAGSQGDVFNSRVSLDTLFKPTLVGSADRADVLIIGHEDGTMNLSMSEDFSIGKFKLEDAGPNLSEKQISTEIRTSQDLPSRFMRNINETLLEKSDCTWVNACYHLAATGHCYPEVKEWLVDELGERGHKRWDKAIHAGYENVRRLTHESLLPALERLSVLVSRLRGLSRFHSSDFSLGLSTLELDNMLDSVNCLQLLAHQLLKCAVSELQQFAAFSTWLRHEIEKQAADPTSASAQEIAEKDMSFDHCSILDYIQGAMQHTQMLAYTDKEPDGGRLWDLEDEGGPVFQLYKRQMNNASSGSRPQRQLPGLAGMTQHFEKQLGIFFQHISETQRRNVQIGSPILLGQGNPKCADVRMVDESELKHDDTTTANLSIYVGLGPSPGQEYDVSRLIQIGFRAGKDSKSDVRYEGMDLAGKMVPEKLDENDVGGGPEIDLRKTRDMSVHAVHIFPPGTTWTPYRLEVNGRKGRRTICVVAEDRIHYRQFDLDSIDTARDLAPRGDGNEDHDVAMSIS